jgi:hypothetical protein
VPGLEPAAAAPQVINYLSMGLSLLAVALTGLTYADQRDANALTRKRYEQRHASRIASWAGQGDLVFIQNRTPVPLHGTYLAFHRVPDPQGDVQTQSGTLPERSDAITAYLVPDVQPCTVARLRKPVAKSATLFLHHMYFADGDGQTWRNGVAGVQPVPEGTAAMATMMAELRQTAGVLEMAGAEPAGDCTDA